MEVKIIHNADEAYGFLKDKCRYDYIYQFNNLESDNWVNIVCYGLYENRELKNLAMLNINYGMPVLLAACFHDQQYNIELLSRIKQVLPAKFYTHIDRTTLEAVFKDDKISDLHDYLNMGFDRCESIIDSEVIQLGYEDIGHINELLQKSYPEAWLDYELVKLKHNFGIYRNDKLISFAGIHAYSEIYQVAAVAHVTTDPEYRKQGYSYKTILPLLRDLEKNIKYIGLNVKVDNIPARSCYKKIGFKEYGQFVACDISIRE